MTDQEKYFLKSIKNNPEKYISKILRCNLEEYQKNVINSINEHERTAIAACHDVGKSFIMARIATWFLTTKPRSKVITTAPTFNQVERILWSEIRTAAKQSRIPLGGKLNLTDWTFSSDWFALGFTSKNEVSENDGQGTQSSFQGFHAENILIIFDEATGINHNVWNMAEGLLTSANVKFVAIGNPTSKSSKFYECFKDRSWHKIYLSCFDSPNLKINNINNIDDLINEIDKVKSMNDLYAEQYLSSYKIDKPYLLTTKWVVSSAMKWGIDHPLTQGKILGKFPEITDDTLVSLGDVEKAQIREYTPIESDRISVGVDVARYGSDSTVITVMHGFKVLHKKVLFKNSLTEVSGETINIAKEYNANIIVIDETGLGSGVVDILIESTDGKSLNRNVEIRGVQFGESCADEKDHEKYVNIKAKMFDLLREDIKNNISLLNENVYLEELPTIKFKYDKKGRMQIESKDEYKKRTGRSSPDSSDSLALANYGRYDEIKTGVFTNDFAKTSNTITSSMNNKREW